MKKLSYGALALLLIALLASSALAVNYRLGDESDEIATVQTALKQLKFYAGDITGHFGAKTETAVIQFQRRYKLNADGIVGEETLAKIYEKAGINDFESFTPAQSTPSAAPSTGSTALLRYGSQNSAVRALQEDLTRLGYYKGSVTGHYGSQTEASVAAFQRANGLSADGIAGAKTLAAISSKTSGKSGSSSSAVSSSASVSSSAMLRLGSQSESVRAMQEALKALGYYKGSVTGNFGNLTKDAVMAFQRANGLGADGIAGAKTLAAIASKSSGKSSPSDPPASSGAATTKDLKLNTAGAYSVGSKGDTVKNMQQMLRTLGYYDGSVTGSFGNKTKDAVIAFQKAKGLSADGIAGAKTLAAIESDYKRGNKVGASSSEIAAASSSNIRYENFLSWRTHYANGEYCTVYDPATGISWQLRIMTKDKHMDAEPVTADDTAMMNKAFGKTTWTPKVVYVTFADGRTYLGSTHNTPHGTSKISTNNFKGHLCVHFPIPMATAEGIGSYAVSHQEAINAAWNKITLSQR